MTDRKDFANRSADVDMTVSTTVVIPNYNGMKYLPECLASLDALEEDFAVYIVDNGSTDGSAEYLKSMAAQERRKPLRVCFITENTGFCGAVNQGIRNTETPFVLLLNNDTKVYPGFVRALEECLLNQDKIFSASAQVLVMQNPELIDDAGDYYCALGWAFARGKGKRREDYGKPGEIFAACGAAAIYRRSVLEQIGLFDEGHFAYLEDIDLGYRARIFGYVNRYEPRAKLLHAGSAVSGSRHNAFKVSLSSRNSIYLIWKNMPFLQHLLNLPFILLGIMVKALFFARKGLGGVYIKGVCRGIALSCSREGRAKRIAFKMSHFRNYLRIQLELWQNLFRLPG